MIILEVMTDMVRHIVSQSNSTYWQGPSDGPSENMVTLPSWVSTRRTLPGINRPFCTISSGSASYTPTWGYKDDENGNDVVDGEDHDVDEEDDRGVDNENDHDDDRLRRNIS